MHKNLPKFNDLNYVHLITAKTYKNKRYFKDEKCCLILLEELDFYRKELGFKILGYVIMPDHLHCLIFWEVDEYPKLTISKIMLGIKTMTSKRVKRYLFYDNDINYFQSGMVDDIAIRKSSDDITMGRSGDVARPTLAGVDQSTHGNIVAQPTHQGFKFWQSGFHDFNIYTEKKLKEKFDYMHITNPIKAGLCTKPEGYKWSSYRQIMGIEKQSVLKVDFL